MKKICAFLLCLLLLTACADGGSLEVGGGGAATAEVSLMGEIAGEISVSCYDSMTYRAFLEGAAKQFEEKYPGTKINVQTFAAMPEIKSSDTGDKKVSVVSMQDDVQGREDYIKRVSTELMSGGGADILAMDILPLHRYVDAGQLENLEGYMSADPDFDRSEYRENILNALKFKNGIWMVPLDYSFTYYTYDTTLLTGEQAVNFGTGSALSIEELVNIAAPIFDGGSKMFNIADYAGARGDMLGKLLEENYSSLVDLGSKRANFAGNFEQLLIRAVEYADRGYISRGIAAGDRAEAIIGGTMEAPTARYYYKPKDSFSLSQLYNKDSGMRMFNLTQGAEPGIEEDDEVAGIASDAQGNVPFGYSQSYAINSNSQNKQTAWAFIKFLLSEEIQLSTGISTMSLPVNNAARDQKAELVLSGAFMSGGQALTRVQQEVLNNYKRAVEELSDQINTYTFEDSTINDMIATETSYFFSGEKSAQEVASALQGRADLYLSE